MTENQSTPEPDAPTGYAGTPGAGPETPAGAPGTSSGSTGSGATPPPAGPAATPPYPPRRPPLRRSRTDRVLTGVCGGFAENLGIDATLIRILVVVATVFSGGALLIAYVVAWALMPDTPLQPVAVYVTPQGGQQAQPEPAMAGAAAAGATAAYPTGAYPTSYAAGGTGTYVDPQTGTVYGSPAYPPPPRRSEPRSFLGLITLSAAVVVGGLFALAGALGATIPAVVPAASILLVLGVGLLVGAWRGRARWLIVPALIMVLVVQGIAAVGNVVGKGGSGVGERTWTPTSSSASFNLGAGSARLDLTELPAGDATIDVSMGVGELIVLVPPGTAVELTGTIGAGELDLPGQRPVSGTDLTVQETVPAVAGTTTTTTVALTAQLGLGQLEVRRAAS